MLNEYSSQEIYVRHAIDDTPCDENFNMHIHATCEIYLFITGDVEYLVEGSIYPFTGSSLMIMRPAEAHRARIKSPERYERYAINFPVSLISMIDPEVRLLKPFFNREIGTNNILTAEDIDICTVTRLFSEMCENENVDCYSRNLTLTTHIYTLADMINRAFSSKAANRYSVQSAAQKIVMYVNEHLFENISVPALARHFYLSPSQFSRVFKKATGAAPWEYIMQKRLTAAKEMIRSGTAAYSACEQCGFGDYSSFYRAYVKHFGAAPKDIL